MRARAAVAAAPERAGLDAQVAQAVVGQPYDGDVLALGPQRGGEPVQLGRRTRRTRAPAAPAPGWSCGTTAGAEAAGVPCSARAGAGSPPRATAAPSSTATASTSRPARGSHGGQHRPILPHRGSGRRSLPVVPALVVCRHGCRPARPRAIRCARRRTSPRPPVDLPGRPYERVGILLCPLPTGSSTRPNGATPGPPWTPGTRTGVPGPAATGCAPWCTEPTTSPSCWRRWRRPARATW